MEGTDSKLQIISDSCKSKCEQSFDWMPLFGFPATRILNPSRTKTKKKLERLCRENDKDQPLQNDFQMCICFGVVESVARL